MTQENKASKGLLITLPAAIIAIVLILGKIDTPVTNILFYVVAFGVIGLTVSSLIKDYKKRKIDDLSAGVGYLSYLKLTTLKKYSVVFNFTNVFFCFRNTKATLDHLKNGSVSTSFHTIPTGFEPAISPRQGE